MSTHPETLRDGRYALTRKLGEGGQAATFEAVDKRTGKRVAIKRFRVRGAQSWKEVELAEREARVLASLSHPHLPRYVEHFEHGGELFLVTEMIEGESLLSLRKRGVRFSDTEVIRLLRESAAVLDYLHSRAPPVVHRDIKPSNVLRRADGSFAIIDFGSVRDRLKPEGGSTVVGTFGYMAPEQFQGRAMPVSDVYALGATALAMLSGSEPEDLPHTGLAIDVAAALGTSAAAPLVDVLRAMLEPNPDLRPTRLTPLLERLERRLPRDRGTKPSARQRDRDDSSKRSERSRQPPQERWQREWRHRLQEQEERRSRNRAAMAVRTNGWIVTLALIGLAIAQVAVALAVQAAVPLLLTILSVVFGKGMREAAKRTAEAGQAAQAALKRAVTFVSEQAEQERIRVAGLAEARGVRVQQVRDDDVAGDTGADREAQAEREAAQQAESGVSRRTVAADSKPGKH